MMIYAVTGGPSVPSHVQQQIQRVRVGLRWVRVRVMVRVRVG